MPFFFESHLAAPRHADVVVAVCNGPDTDSGTAWKMGYAAVCSIRIMALRTDSRLAGNGIAVNLMLTQSAEMATGID